MLLTRKETSMNILKPHISLNATASYAYHSADYDALKLLALTSPDDTSLAR